MAHDDHTLRSTNYAVRSTNAGIIVAADAPLHRALDELAYAGRVVCFAGLPGTGKSLMIHQLAHLAHRRGRNISLLQWDTARPLFEASEAGRRYPQVDGVTHGMIRVAVGRWARHALAQWHAQHAGADDLLIGETPFVGHRLIELARPADDAAEPVLNLPTCRFVVPVPSRTVRQHMEAERERRTREPQHEREKEDAPPHVLGDLWQQLAQVAATLGLAPPAGSGAQVPYDPDIYRNVYLKVLSRRHAQVLPLDVILPASGLSAYYFQIARADLLPTESDIARFLHEAERAFPDGARPHVARASVGTAGSRVPDGAALAYEIEHWYDE
jgi:hypothetical protein